MGVFVLKLKVNLETPFMPWLVSDVLIHVVCCRFALLRVWTVNSGLWAVYKLTRFTFPECWTGIEKEIVYIEMLNTRR